MWLECAIVCATLYALFGEYITAKAKMIHEEARAKELENDIKEFGVHDETGS